MKKIEPNFEKRGGLLPVVVQCLDSGDVLMLAYANKTALDETIKTKIATYYSTSRNEIWVKGKTSGNVQIVKEVLMDCDEDALIYLVNQQGQGACHTGNRKCFFRSINI